MFDPTNQFGISVRVNNRDITEYSHDGTRFIEGRDGNPFTVRLTNNSYERVEAILSVDGLSVLNGKEAGLASPGYVINAKSYLDVSGWTKGLTEAQEFFFTGKGNSYSNRRGKATNTGVIGALFFRELPSYNHGLSNPIAFHNITSKEYKGIRGSSTWANSGWSDSGAIGSNSLFDADDFSKAIPGNNIGTGWGDKIKQNLTTVSFTKRDPNHPDGMTVLYYDDRKGLERRGIILDRTKLYPDPFPVYNNSTGIGCPDPE